MFNIGNLDVQTKAYFDTLPKIIQENIVQSGVAVSGKEELEKMASMLET